MQPRELEQRYAHQADALDGLIGQSKDSYLLVEVEPYPQSAARSTRLAHDLLAPLVQQRFRLSVAPGQRARRMLENRAPEWHDGKVGPVLDSTDLATVEGGASGMRVWTSDEGLMVAASRRAEEQRRVEEQERSRRMHEAEERQRKAEADKEEETERRLREQEKSNRKLRRRAVALSGILAVAVVAAALAFLLWRDAREQRNEATKETRIAKLTTASLSLDRGLALAQQGKARNGLLWLARTLELNPEESSSLDRVIRLNLAAWKSRVPISRGCLKHPEREVMSIRFSPDGQTLATIAGFWDDEAPFRGYLWNAVTGERIAGPLAASGEVYAVAFSRDSSVFATGSGPLFGHKFTRGEARAWNTLTGQQIGPSMSSRDPITALALSPDGALLFMGSRDGKVYRYHVQSGASAGLPLPHENAVRSLAISPDGMKLLSGTHGLGSRLWDVSTGRQIGQGLAHDASITNALFSPDGMQALTAGSDGAVQLWEPATGRRLGAFVDPALNRAHSDEVRVVAFDPRGRSLFTSSADGTAKLWDVATLTLQGLYNTVGLVTSASISPDGEILATHSSDNHVRVFESHTGILIGQPTELRNNFYGCVTFDRDKGLFFTSAGDGFVRAWETPTKAARLTIRLGSEIRGVAFNPKGRSVLAWSLRDGTAWLRDVGTGDAVGRPIALGNGDPLSGAVFSPDGRYVAAYGIQGERKDVTVRICDAATGDVVAPPLVEERTGGGEVYALLITFGPEGKRLLMSHHNGQLESTISLWDVQGGQMLWKTAVTGHCEQTLYPPDGRTVLIADTKGNVLTLDPATGNTMARRFKHSGSIHSLKLSPNGEVLATGGLRDAKLWNASTGQEIGTPMNHAHSVQNVAFSLDGMRVATVSEDYTARVWDSSTGQPLTEPLPHDGSLYRVDFAAEGTMIVTSGDTDRARIWDVATGKEVGPGLSHSARVVASAVSPDGRTILTGSLDGTIKVWDVPEPETGDVREIRARIRALTAMDFGEKDAIDFHNDHGWSSTAPMQAASEDRLTRFQVR